MRMRPSAVTALMAATSTKVAVYVLIRFVYTVLGADFAFGELSLAAVLLGLAVLGMLTASAVAVTQPDARRMLAYSSVAQVGYMVLGLSLASVTGLTAALLHMMNHALMKSALFMALGCVAYRLGGTAVTDLRGLGRSMPWTMAAFVGGGLSLIGVPLTVGFISKWYLVLAALEQGCWMLVVAVVASSLLAVVYIWRIVEVAYFQGPARADVKEAPWSLLAPTWILVLANFWLGIDTRATVGLAEQAARTLLGARAVNTATALQLCLLVPALGAAGIVAAGRWPNLRETVTLVTAAALFVLRARRAGGTPGRRRAHRRAGRAAARPPAGAAAPSRSACCSPCWRAGCGSSPPCTRSATCARSASRTRRASTCASRSRCWARWASRSPRTC